MLSVGVGLKILSWFTGGGLNGLLDAGTNIYKAKLAAGNDHDKMAADLAARELQLEYGEAQLQAKLNSDRPGVIVRTLFAGAAGLYTAKIFVWDKCLHLGVTDPLDDRMYWVLQTIIISYFGYHAVGAIMSSFRAR